MPKRFDFRPSEVSLWSWVSSVSCSHYRLDCFPESWVVSDCRYFEDRVASREEDFWTLKEKPRLRMTSWIFEKVKRYSQHGILVLALLYHLWRTSDCLTFALSHISSLPVKKAVNSYSYLAVRGTQLNFVVKTKVLAFTYEVPLSALYHVRKGHL